MRKRTLNKCKVRNIEIMRFFTKNKLCLLMLVALVFSSCSKKNYENVAYFITEEHQRAPIEVVNTEPTIKVDDALTISVSALDPNSVASFNLPAVSYLTPGSSSLNFSQNLQSYVVDQNGEINYPILGKIKVEGMTRKELQSYLEAKISQTVDSPIVNVNIANFRFSVLGEVTRPGVFETESYKISILEALSKAGDLTVYGERNNVMLIRQIDGKNHFFTFDLNNDDIFKSPVYYLQQNDIIYVTPNKSKRKNARYSQSDSYNISLFSAIISSVSVITSLLIALLVK